LAMHIPFFERGKEAFQRCIVPAIATLTHAAHDAPFSQTLLIVMSGLLATPITMKK
jgi:hypothetical protein